LVFRTLNPKTNRWNKEKKGTYSDILVLYRNRSNGHIENTGLSFAYTREDDLEKFLETFPEATLTDYQKNALIYLRAIFKTRKHLTYTIHENPTPEEQEEIKKNEQEAKELIPKLMNHYIKEERENAQQKTP
jgi:hypothetical protein